jgi:hypothetical protein
MTKANTQAIRVYVPVNAPTDSHQDVKSYFSQRFGGYTEYSVNGGWESDSGQCIQEPVKIYECVADTNEPVTVAKRLAQMVKAQSDEDAVMWEIRPVTVMGME